MAKNNIELAIGSKFDGEGFTKLNNALKQSSGNVRKVSGAVGNMLSNMDGLDGSAGRLVRTAGGLIGGFLSMGVWGVAIAGVTKLVGWLGKLNEMQKEARLAAKGLSKEYMTLEAAARGYQRRVESYKQKRADKEDADRKAAEAAKKAAEAEAKAMDEKIAAEKEYDQYLMKTAALKEKIAGLTDEQIAVNSAQRQLEFENKWGGQYSQTEAGLKLELAKKALAKKFDEQADAILAELDAQDAEKKAIEDSAKAKKASADKEKQITKLKEDAAKKIKDIDEKIANLREQAAQLEADAARARGGKTFGQWQREERNLARQAALDAKKQENVIKNAERERDNIGGRIFDRNGKLRKSANPFDIKRFNQLSEFINKQDPNNNGLLQQAQQLEQQKQQMIQETKTAVEAIAMAMKNGGVAM